MRDRRDKPPTTATVAVANKLREGMFTGKYRDHYRLPPERELAQAFGCSRSTIRSALAYLEAQHLVTPRQGSGYVVHHFTAGGGPELLEPLARLNPVHDELRLLFLADLLLVRRHLLYAMLNRIDRRVPEEDIADIRQTLASFAHSASILDTRKARDLDIIAAMDMGVLDRLSLLTRGYVFRLHFHPVGHTLLNTPDLGAAVFKNPKVNAAAWQTLLRWLCDGRPGGMPPMERLFFALDFRALLAYRRAHPM